MLTGKCPRCNGQMSHQYDEGWEDVCLQCGYIRYSALPKTNHLRHQQYDVSLPYTGSPLIGRCVAFPVLPFFARQLPAERKY